MEYHSFLFEPRRCLTVNQWVIVSVSLRSIIHSYVITKKVNIKKITVKFPSPYGVSFILIYQIILREQRHQISFRLLTELYSFLCY